MSSEAAPEGKQTLINALRTKKCFVEKKNRYFSPTGFRHKWAHKTDRNKARSRLLNETAPTPFSETNEKKSNDEAGTQPESRWMESARLRLRPSLLKRRDGGRRRDREGWQAEPGSVFQSKAAPDSRPEHRASDGRARAAADEWQKDCIVVVATWREQSRSAIGNPGPSMYSAPSLLSSLLVGR